MDVQAQVEGSREVEWTVWGLGQLGCYFRLFVCFQQSFSCIPNFFLLKKREIILGVITFWHKCLCEHLTLNQSFSVYETWCAQTGRKAEEGPSLPWDRGDAGLCTEHSRETCRGEKKRENQTKDNLLLQQMQFCRRWYCKIVISPVLWVSLAIFLSLLKTKGGKQSKLLCGHGFFLLMDVWGLYVVFLLTCTSIFPFNHTNTIRSFFHD